MGDGKDQGLNEHPAKVFKSPEAGSSLAQSRNWEKAGMLETQTMGKQLARTEARET